MKWYLGGIAGDELAALERVKRGQLDGEAGAIFCQRLAPTLRVARVPGLFESREEFIYVVGPPQADARRGVPQGRLHQPRRGGLRHRRALLAPADQVASTSCIARAHVGLEPRPGVAGDGQRHGHEDDRDVDRGAFAGVAAQGATTPSSRAVRRRWPISGRPRRATSPSSAPRRCRRAWWCRTRRSIRCRSSCKQMLTTASAKFMNRFNEVSEHLDDALVERAAREAGADQGAGVAASSARSSTRRRAPRAEAGRQRCCRPSTAGDGREDARRSIARHRWRRRSDEPPDERGARCRQ